MLGKSQVKYIQSLGQKKYRDEAGEFIAEGPKLVAELLSAVPAQVQHIYATEEWLGAHEPELGETPFTSISEAELQRISGLSTSNQVLALVKKFIPPPAIDVKDKLVLALDTIQDPGNLGTIIRIADWFGIGQIVCSHECADLYNPKVVQSTMGSIARVKLFYTDLPAWLASEKGVRIYATALEGRDVTGMEKPSQGIIVIGNESKGIREEIMQAVDVRITIPRKGRAESLNAAVATGIVLSHLLT